MLYLLGLNHRSAPIEVRERLYFPREELVRHLPELVATSDVTEAMIVSTCNRTEVITSARRPEEAASAIRRFIEKRRPAESELLDQHAYRAAEMEVARHVFRVASSLDSMVLGEAQILGQVKSAYAAAQEAGTIGPALSGLMQRAFTCAKRVRTDTKIAKNPVSIAYAAADLAEKIFGALEGHPIMILGAGEMGTLTARHLIRKGVDLVLVSNRTYQDAVDLARELDGEAIGFDQFLECMARADVVIASTAAPHYILKADQAQGIMKARRRRPLFIVDLAVPRNVDPALNDVDNIFLYNVDDLQAVADAGMAERQREAARAEELIEEELRGYAVWIRGIAAQPTIVDLRRRFHEVASSELRRLRSRLGDLQPVQEEAVGNLLRCVINKLLHAPTVELKQALRSQDGHDLVILARRLFDLGEAESLLAEAGRPAPPDDAGEGGGEGRAVEEGPDLSREATRK
jgi:glutamyl-tRNA reductase